MALTLPLKGQTVVTILIVFFSMVLVSLLFARDLESAILFVLAGTVAGVVFMGAFYMVVEHG